MLSLKWHQQSFYKKYIKNTDSKLEESVADDGTAELLKTIAKDIQYNPLVRKYLLDHTWLSGSSTTVYPITVSIPGKSIHVQLNTDKNVFKNLLKKYEEKYPELAYATFWKSDGSCPSTLNFYLQDGVRKRKSLDEAEEFKPNGVVDEIKKRGDGDLDVESPLELNTGVLPVLDVGTYGREDYIFRWDDEEVPEDAEADWEELDRNIIAYGTPVVEEYIKQVLPSAKVEGTKVYHPQYYNYSTDELEFSVSFDVNEYNKLEDKAVKDPAFGDYLKENYKSYSGFFSYLADNLDEFYQQDGWKRFVQVVMFYLRNEDFESTTDRFWEDIICNGLYVK